MIRTRLLARLLPLALQQLLAFRGREQAALLQQLVEVALR